METSTQSLTSWGRTRYGRHRVWQPEAPEACRALWEEREGPLLLARGLGRSYGDSNLNSGQGAILTTGWTGVRHFDRDEGRITCEAGMSLGDLWAQILPHGWGLPVTPGTRHVTIGGAIANDIHGKNHHRDGTFGRWVEALTLGRSDGSILRCATDENPEWREATIGGLGMTGVILTATIRLQPASGYVATRSRAFHGLSGYLEWEEREGSEHAFTVAWLDLLHRNVPGIYLMADPLPPERPPPGRAPSEVPLPLPRILCRPLLGTFNRLYLEANRRRGGTTDIFRFFYPLDRVRAWNRLYGRQGLVQLQVVIPEVAAMAALIEEILRMRTPCYLAVLKRFGSIPAAGLLSFARPGLTLACDFPHRGLETERELRRLHDLTLEAGGAIYPAKDLLMTPEDFRRGFPRWAELAPFRDRRFSSDFWRRVEGDG